MRNRATITEHVAGQTQIDVTGDFVPAGGDRNSLELVRFGIRRPGDPLIEDSLRVIDAALKTVFPVLETMYHMRVVERDDGGPYMGWGVGRPWPLLTGERGHYELAAGRDVRPFVRAMENFSRPSRGFCQSKSGIGRMCRRS
jgi:GH15 family glucan-1,4-alpha-glucosidase